AVSALEPRLGRASLTLFDPGPGQALHEDGDRVLENREHQAMLARARQGGAGFVTVGEPGRTRAGLKQRARGVVVGHVTNPKHFGLNRGTAAPQTPAGWRMDRAAAARRGVVMSVGLLETRI